jgi:hypothetical protein
MRWRRNLVQFLEFRLDPLAQKLTNLHPSTGVQVARTATSWEGSSSCIGGWLEHVFWTIFECTFYGLEGTLPPSISHTCWFYFMECHFRPCFTLDKGRTGGDCSCWGWCCKVKTEGCGASPPTQSTTPTPVWICSGCRWSPPPSSWPLLTAVRYKFCSRKTWFMSSSAW